MIQVMAALQTTLGMPPLVDVTLETWSVFLTTLGPPDIGPFVGATSAAFLASWKGFSFHERETAKRCLEYIVVECGDKLGKYLDEIAEVRAIPELGAIHVTLNNLRRDWEPEDKLRRILERSSSDNLAIACQALEELKAFMISKQGVFVRSLAHGDAFSPLVGEIVSKLCEAASRDEDHAEPLRLLAYTCIGIFGAVDPDRFELSAKDPNIIMLSNFNDETEAVEFALHLIRDVLVGVFRSASDINYQTHVAFVIQELLKFCKFTPNLVSAASTGSVPLKTRNRWNNLPRHVLETIAPFLESKYRIVERPENKDVGLVYPNHATYRDWIQQWAASLLDKVSGTYVDAIFPMFHWIVVHKDAGIAHHLLPHLVLNVLISGGDQDVELIRSEILAVLQDQVNPDGKSSPDKRLLSTQVNIQLDIVLHILTLGAYRLFSPLWII
jgi:serine/threonine-protein kinase ATR